MDSGQKASQAAAPESYEDSEFSAEKEAREIRRKAQPTNQN